MRILLFSALTIFFSVRSFSQCSPNFSFFANGQIVSFTDNSTSSQGTIVSYYWNFGDGAFSFMQNPIHTFASTGCYIVKLTIQNSQGNCNDSIARMICVNLPVHVNLCPPSATITLNSNVSGSSYQWELSTDSGSIFSNLNNGGYYTGATTNILQLNNVPSSFRSYQYRCRADGNNSGPVNTIHFTNTWTGSANTSWSNTANWSCGQLPDMNTDVIINSGIIIINSNITIRTLTLNPSVNLIVNPGFTLTILK
jgi:PKD repeat protein